MYELGRVPAEGDAVRLGSGSLVVERMRGNRVERLRLVPDTRIATPGVSTHE
jgi:CBS domain containing-hemolysin-like protein